MLSQLLLLVSGMVFTDFFKLKLSWGTLWAWKGKVSKHVKSQNCTGGPPYLWIQNLWIPRAYCTTPFYSRDLNIRGFWYLRGFWNHSPMDTEGRSNKGIMERYHRIQVCSVRTLNNWASRSSPVYRESTVSHSSQQNFLLFCEWINSWIQKTSDTVLGACC